MFFLRANRLFIFFAIIFTTNDAWSAQYLSNQDYENKLEDLKSSLFDSPDIDISECLNLAGHYLLKEKDDFPATNATEVLRVTKDCHNMGFYSGELFVLRSQAFLAQANYERALAELSKARYTKDSFESYLVGTKKFSKPEVTSMVSQFSPISTARYKYLFHTYLWEIGYYQYAIDFIGGKSDSSSKYEELMRLGYINTEMEKFDLAESYYQRLGKIVDGTYYDFQYCKYKVAFGRFYYLKKEYDLAREQYKQALAGDPGCIQANSGPFLIKFAQAYGLKKEADRLNSLGRGKVREERKKREEQAEHKSSYKYYDGLIKSIEFRQKPEAKTEPEQTNEDNKNYPKYAESRRKARAAESAAYQAAEKLEDEGDKYFDEYRDLDGQAKKIFGELNTEISKYLSGKKTKDIHSQIVKFQAQRYLGTFDTEKLVKFAGELMALASAKPRVWAIETISFLLDFGYKKQALGILSKLSTRRDSLLYRVNSVLRKFELEIKSDGIGPSKLFEMWGKYNVSKGQYNKANKDIWSAWDLPLRSDSLKKLKRYYAGTRIEEEPEEKPKEKRSYFRKKD